MKICFVIEEKVAGVSGADRMIDRKPSDRRDIAETLIAEAQGARVKAHVQAMLSRMRARHRTQPKQAANFA
jgi:hypothetical protein